MALVFLVLISDLERLLRWKRLPLYGPFGYVEMIMFLMIKIASLTCQLWVYRYASFMVTSSTGGRIKNRDLYTIGGYSGGYFSLYGWPHNLPIGLLPTPNVIYKLL
jgi:hypothetical protein